MAKSLARFRGVCLTPGVSKNNRLYTREVIAKAVDRAQERINQGHDPITVLTHHGAGDDSTRIIGTVRSMAINSDGSATYEADLADTDAGRNILGLIDTDGGAPFLTGVSIRGAWLGPVLSKSYEGRDVDYAEALELDGVDLTKSPGVNGAGITSVTRADELRPAESADGRALIYESAADAKVTFVETTSTDEGGSGGGSSDDDDENTEKGAPALKSGKDAAPQTKAKKYADPGYQDDGMSRYALDTKAQAKSAWSYINQKDNASKYTAGQLSKVKSRIIGALKKFGVGVNAKEGWIVDVDRITRETLAESGATVNEAGVNISLDNGLFTLSFYSYRVDPADLDVIARAAMNAACDAVKAIDPDSDGDIDVAGATGNYSDDDRYPMAMSHEPPASASESGESTTTEAPAAASATAEEEQEAPAMAETTNTQKGGEQQTPPSGVGENADQGASTAPTTPAETAPAAPAVPVAPAGTFQVVLTNEQFQQLIGNGNRPATEQTQQPPAQSGTAQPQEHAAANGATEQANEAPQTRQGTTETGATSETEDQRVERRAQEIARAAIQKHVETEGVSRKGLVPQPQETGGDTGPYADFPAGWPRKPLDQYTQEEFSKYVSGSMESVVLRHHRTAE